MKGQRIVIWRGEIFFDQATEDTGFNGIQLYSHGALRMWAGGLLSEIGAVASSIGPAPVFLDAESLMTRL